ncbi:MAG: SDR family NAD(P)-dependent oxidoreductase [Bacteroidota bacterium]
MKSVAITGASQGLGARAAIEFAQKGYQVLGTVFSESELTNLQEQSEFPDLHYFTCDVTQQDQVDNWAAFVAQTVKGKGIDILINNAGVLTPGPIEILPFTEITYEFEVNVFGSLRVINSFLPMLRQAQGRILQIGSVSGILPVPYNGVSSASKATMEAFADVFRTELRPFSVDFVMVAPGNMLTAGPAKTIRRIDKLTEDMTSEQRALYGKEFGSFSKVFTQMQSTGIPVKAAAERLIEIAEKNPAPIRAGIGEDAEEMRELVKVKTDEELDAMRSEMFGLTKTKENT